MSPGVEPAGRAVILVVEDEPEIRELEKYFLERAGFEVQFADDGELALEMVNTMNPDVVVTELLVPKLDGLALCRAIKGDESHADAAVLVFSFLAAAGRAKEAGADAFLRKPLARRALIEAVQRLLRQQREGEDG